MSTQTNEFTLGSFTSRSRRQLRIVPPTLSLCTVGSKYPKSHLFCNNNVYLEWKGKESGMQHLSATCRNVTSRINKNLCLMIYCEVKYFVL